LVLLKIDVISLACVIGQTNTQTLMAF